MRSSGESLASGESLRLNFDSSRYVEILKAEGFTEQESNGLISLISEVVEESMQTATKALVTKKQKLEMFEDSIAELQKIKMDIVNLERRDFASLKENLDVIRHEVEGAKTTLVNDVSKIHAGVRLDMNLEKSRYDILNNLLTTLTRIQVEATDLMAQLKAAEEKIDVQMDKLEKRMNLISVGTKKGTQRFLVTSLALLIGFRIIMLMT